MSNNEYSHNSFLRLDWTKGFCFVEWSMQTWVITELPWKIKVKINTNTSGLPSCPFPLQHLIVL